MAEPDSIAVTSRLVSEISQRTDVAAKSRATQIEQAVGQSEAYAKHYWERERVQMEKVQGLVHDYIATQPARRTQARKMVCGPESSAVVECYRKDPLACRRLVAEFAQCAQRHNLENKL
eukprot:TRINITY_DN6195_c0_g2_i1.p1 TRINITY_DN6195_c0_g2~~TRINITY_DN6195_c0_g2_i1.p1  ORF type:complete len:119 (-),score=18.87 TRINITY_DN6195_c0_g2_i1:296-652(-)